MVRIGFVQQIRLHGPHPPSCPERGLCEAHVHANETDEKEKDETDKKCVCGCR